MRTHKSVLAGLKTAAVAALVLVVIGPLFTNLSHAQPPIFSVDVDRSRASNLYVPLNKSRVIQLQAPVNKISVGNPDIADILTLRARQLYVLGKGLGTTNVLLWDASDQLIAAINIEVTHDLDGLRAQMGRLLPGEPIEVGSAQGSLILSGEASSAARMDSALRLAGSFGGSRDVVNMMTVGGAQQVMLEVKVAEISRTLGKTLGIDFNAIHNRSTRWSVGAVNGGGIADPGLDLVAVDPLDISDRGLFANFLSQGFAFNSVLNAAKDNGLAKILAEPTLTTLSGQEAIFLSGGEFPIPVPDRDRGITISYKEFGVGVKFIPVVLDSGHINLKLSVTVSDLIAANNVQLSAIGSGSTFFVPALAKRSASSTVELADGQTIGIAGLLSETTRDSVSKFPGLGDIPILGQLFKSKEYVKGETELVILVTPHLAKPLPAGRPAMPTDNALEEPSDSEFFILGNRVNSQQQDAADPVASKTSGELYAEGRFGHVIKD